MILWLLLTTALALPLQTEQKYLLSPNKRQPLSLEIFYGNDPTPRLTGQLAMSFPEAVGAGESFDCVPNDPSTSCFSYGDYANLTVKEVPGQIEDDYCLRFEWRSTQARNLEDCFLIGNERHLYGGAETFWQYWPMNRHTHAERPYVTSDFLTGIEFGNLVENYWLLSTGVSLHVDEDNPLFVSYNTTRADHLCFISMDKHPYNKRDELNLKYTACVSQNVKTVHTRNFHSYYSKPTALPDERMLLNPLWSTWAQYRKEVNQSIMLDLAHKAVEHGFGFSSHVEIDDKWETCYGQEEFDLEKFPDPKAMVDEIHDLGLRVTLWVQPFIDFECPLFTTGVDNDHFLRDQKGRPAITAWFGGSRSGGIDITREGPITWWAERLEKIRSDYGIDSFKFDAGEVNWLPHSVLLEDSGLGPNYYTQKYVEAVARFGGMVETRVGRGTQALPIFTRLMDRDSHWGYNAGLKSVIPTVLLFSVLGYPFALPDMIGGTGFNPGFPTKELFLRWVAMNVFMPSVQFSVVPWDERFDAETIELTRNFLQIRETFKDEILAVARQAVEDGSPINRPIWWVDPEDPVTFTIDDEYMMGDQILVAPVVEEGATARDIYLPVGEWMAGNTNETFLGPIWLRDYPVGLSELPYFILV